MTLSREALERTMRLHRWLFDIAPRLTRLENQALQTVGPGLTFRQYRILCRVEEGSRTISEIGRLATLSLPAISESAEGLVRKGLLAREINTADRRSAPLALTAAGRRAMKEADLVLDSLAQELLDDLNESEVTSFQQNVSTVSVRVIERLRGGLDRAATKD